MKRIAFILFFILLTLSIPVKATKVVEVEINGEINEGTAIYINHAFKIAERENADAILIILNTPGGLVMSTEKIVSEILNSKIPVITYVYPHIILIFSVVTAFIPSVVICFILIGYQSASSVHYLKSEYYLVCSPNILLEVLYLDRGS